MGQLQAGSDTDVRGAHAPGVSVVVPTVLRASLVRAVRSVRAQTWSGRLEVVVVVDRDPAACLPAELAVLDRAGADVTVFTGGGLLAGEARNRGAAVASQPLLAFLDDDDEWLPGKLAAQVPLLEQETARGGPVVVGSRVRQRRSGSTATSGAVPARLLRPGQPLEDYLFLDRRPGLHRPNIPTSTLLMSTAVARAVRWQPGLPRHQDWDWLLRAQHEHEVRLVQHPDATVVYDMGSLGSVSAGAAWRDSLAWAREWRDRWDRRTYADFLCGQPLRYAVQARSRAGAAACLRELVGTGRVPGAGPLVYAGSAAVPRPALERALMVLGRRRSPAAREAVPAATPVTLLVSHLTPTFGMEKVVLRLAAELGPDVRVVCIGDPGAPAHIVGTPSSDPGPGIPVTSLGSRLTGWRRLASVPRLRRWSAEQQGTVVAAGVWAVLPLLASRRSLPVRVVAWEHTLTSEKTGGSPRLRLLRAAAALLYRRADLVVCVSDDLREQVRGWLRGVPVVTVPNFLPPVPSAGTAARAAGVENPARVPAPRTALPPVRLLSVGSLTPVKDLPLLLRALALLPAHHELDVLGDGPLRTALGHLADDLGVSGRVRFHGYVDDPAEFYARCDVVVQPSRGETFGLVMFEAAAHARPLVAVDFSHARDLVPGFVVGRLSAPDPQQLAAAVLDVVADPPPPDAFAAAAARRAEHFAPDRLIAAWRAALDPAATPVGAGTRATLRPTALSEVTR